MAGGKETPRQKMIGMMYLVLTALLAMNVSKQILKGYITVNESIETGKENLIENNKRITEGFEAMLNGNPGAKGYFEKAQEAQKLLKEMDKYVDEVKFNVIAASEQIQKADTAHLKYLERIDNYDDPSRVLGVAEPSAPQGGALTAVELREKLNKLHDNLVAMLDNMQKSDKTKLLKDDYEGLKKKIASIKPHDSGAEEDGIKMTWETENFYHLPMAAVVCNLNKMSADLMNLEAEILQVFSGASGKLAIKFDQLKARVIAPSSYIQAGSQYTADIFIAASSSKISKEDMKVYIGIDSAEAAAGKTGIEVPVEAGEGKYLVSTGGQGEQTYKGVIKYKNPDGSFKYYPFSQSYMVSAPSVAVAAEKMNVFYIGVDNPVIVSAAGASPTEIQMSLSGGGATKTGGAGGKYVIRATTPGTCNISVSVKGKAQGAPIKFRVKKIPDPSPKLGVRLCQGVMEFKKVELAGIGGVGAEIPGFDFDVKFPVQGFTFSANVKGIIKEYVCTGANLNPEARQVLQGLNSGGKAFFENITVKAPDGTIRKLPTVSLKVK
jgi:gliding motility-associated protein GldM